MGHRSDKDVTGHSVTRPQDCQVTSVSNFTVRKALEGILGNADLSIIEIRILKDMYNQSLLERS